MNEVILKATNGRWALKLGVCLVSLLTAGSLVAGWVWAASADRARIEGEVQQHSRMVEDHENRLRSIEGQLGEIATDVRWIREQIETTR